jgi:cytochrome c oxidase subunit IV
MAQEEYRRKDEKQEKEEKDSSEREWDKGEQWSGGDALGPLVWGLVIIFAGLAFVALAIGLGGIIGWEVTWPLIIIAVGLAVIIGVFVRPRP